MHGASYTLYTVHGTSHSALYTTVHYKLHSTQDVVHRTLYEGDCAKDVVHSTLNITHTVTATLYTLHGTSHRALYTTQYMVHYIVHCTQYTGQGQGCMFGKQWAAGNVDSLVSKKGQEIVHSALYTGHCTQ